MKNKRTKLTAILLSALMAVSTISSVTWAADLFSDGSEEDVTVVGSVDAIPDVEDEVVADDATLTNVSDSDVKSVTFKVDSNGNVVAEFDLGGTYKPQTKDIKVEKLVNKPATCLAPEASIYRATLSNYGAGEYVVDSNSTVTTVIIGDGLEKLSSWTDDKQQPAIYNGTDYTKDDLITRTNAKVLNCDPTKGDIKGNVGHQAEDATIDSNYKCFLSGDCDVAKYVHYRACKYCSNYIPVGDDKSDGKNPNSLSESEWQTAIADDSRNAVIDDKVDGSGHDWDTSNLITITDKYYQDLSSTNDRFKIGEYTGINADTKNWKNSEDPDGKIYGPTSHGFGMNAFKPYGCHWDGKSMVANYPEDEGDAYYFIVVKCKKCNSVKQYERVYLKDTEGQKDGDYYEEVTNGNVIGFLAKYGADGDDGIITWKEAKIRHQGRNGISVDDSRLVSPLVPVLEDESIVGKYYISTYVTDVDDPVKRVPVDVDRKTETHTWGLIEVAPKDLAYLDGTKSATENDKLLQKTDLEDQNIDSKNLSHINPQTNPYFVVVRDGNGNVIEAKSKNCKTTAKYELCQVCMSCLKKEKPVTVYKKVEQKTAPFNMDRHLWGPWSTETNEADDEYFYIDENTHYRFTYYSRKCEWCGKRGTKLAHKYTEKHNLEEKQVEGGPEQDPSCGEDGYYTVQLQCRCGLKDDSSIKRTSIPATDKHDFGTNPVEVLTVGSIQINKNGAGVTDTSEVVLEDGVYKVDGLEDPFNVYAVVVRKCNICGKYDSNGINNIAPATGKVGVDPSLFIDTPIEGRTVEVTAEALKDPNGIPYSCSAGKATITFDWSGKVDGIAVRPESQPLTIENVPYYTSMDAYRGRTDHKPEVRQEIITKPTATQEGSAIEITKCSVCGEELSRVDVPIAKLGSAPAVKAVAVNYNTVTVTWDAVEGADSYKVYNKSNVLGISKWQLVATVDGTSYTDTGLVTGAKYRYTVKAVVDGHGGEYSKTGAVVSPKLTAPEIKSVTSVGSNKNKVTWTKVDGASGYIVQRKTADGNWTRIATVRGGSNINCRDKKAVAGASYRVRAFRTVEKPNFVKSNVYGPFSTAK